MVGAPELDKIFDLEFDEKTDIRPEPKGLQLNNIQMRQVLILAAAILTFVNVLTATHLDNCTEAKQFSSNQTVGTEFTCTNKTTSRIWNCKMITTCDDQQMCNSFICHFLPSYGSFAGSKIGITDDKGEWLLQQIQVPNLQLKPVLLYQFSRDGSQIVDYYAKVNGFNNTYLFIKFQDTQRRVAGFASLASGGDKYFVQDNSSFVISIDKRIVARSDKNHHQVQLNPHYGPAFWNNISEEVVFGLPWTPWFASAFARCGYTNLDMPFEDEKQQYRDIGRVLPRTSSF